MGSTPQVLLNALAFARRNISVLPLNYPVARAGSLVCSCGRLDCPSPAKHPFARHVPRGVLDASADPVLLKRWWALSPAANLGVATGSIVVLDVDERHDGYESLAALEAEFGSLPQTWRSLTGGGGEHVVFTAPRGVAVKNSAGLLGAGLDVRGEGGFIVAPPSRHICGRPYCWNVDFHPSDVPLAELPPWLVGKLCGPRIASKGPIEASPATAWAKLAAEPAQEGRRNDTIARLTGHLLRRYVDPLVALELVQGWNLTHCRPPLAADEVLSVVDNIAAAEARRREN